MIRLLFPSTIKIACIVCTTAMLLFTERAASQHLPLLTLEEAYQMASSNYPSIQKRGLISKTREYSIENASKGYLPSFTLNSQATYQSDVTNFPFKIPVAGFTLPQFSKDQYKVYGEVNQLVYDGGAIKNQKQSAEVNENIQQQSLEVELYALYDRVNQLFFGALLMKEQLTQNDLLRKDIQNGLDKVNAQLVNGVAYKSSVDEINAQLLQAEQARIQLQTIEAAYRKMLGVLIHASLSEDTRLETPSLPPIYDTITRPELVLYDLQKMNVDLQEKQLNTQLKPRVNLFLQGGYGRPALNLLSNSFQTYFISGVRLNWNLGSLYTYKNSRLIFTNTKKELDIQKEVFLLNTQIALEQQKEAILQYVALIKKDDAIISLRNAVKKAANAQLENGVMNAHDYLTQVYAEDAARQNKILHQIQFLQSQYNYQNTLGKSAQSTIK